MHADCTREGAEGRGGLAADSRAAIVQTAAAATDSAPEA